MQVSKDKIGKGIVKYIRQDMIPNVPDKSMQMILDGAAMFIEKKPDILDPYIKNGIIAMALGEKNGMYDIDEAEEVLTNLMNKYGGFAVTIPPIRFLMPEAKEMNFSADDVRKLKQYIGGAM